VKTITAYECDFCKKLYRSRGGISNHEKRCFYNSATRSCITCQFLSTALFVNGKLVTALEQNIYEFKVEGTFHVKSGTDNDGYAFDFNEFNDEYKYLEEAENRTFCTALNTDLFKLRTNCNQHNPTPQPTCPACGSTLVLDWPDKVQCRRCEHTWGR